MTNEVKKEKFGVRAGRYFRELKSEFKKIVWPTWAQTKNNTGVVISLLILVGVFIAVVDFLFSWLVSVLLK